MDKTFTKPDNQAILLKRIDFSKQHQLKRVVKQTKGMPSSPVPEVAKLETLKQVEPIEEDNRLIASSFRRPAIRPVLVEPFEKLSLESSKSEFDPALAEAARLLLKQLKSQGNQKIDRSQFVAYLEELGGVEEKKLADVLRQFASEDEWKEWNAIERDWIRYESTGLGYNGYAFDKFSEYYFHENSQDIPFGLYDLEQEVKRSNDSTAWYQIGLMNSMYGDEPNAIAAFNKSDLSEAKLELAACCINLNCLPDAIAALEKLYGLGKEQAPIQERVRSLYAVEDSQVHALLHLIEGRHEDAVDCLESYNPLTLSERAIHQNRLGAIKAGMEKYEEAISSYKEALLTHSDSEHCGKIQENLAVSYFNLNKNEEAKEWIERANRQCGQRSAEAMKQLEHTHRVICGL